MSGTATHCRTLGGGPTTVNIHLRLVRVLFKYANDIEATERGIRYQIGLKGIPKSIVRKHEAKQPAKEFTSAEIHALLAEAGVPMRAFVLLGINCAYGTMDIARLKTADIDFRGQWLGEPRGKTGISRGGLALAGDGCGAAGGERGAAAVSFYSVRQ